MSWWKPLWIIPSVLPN
jgi:nickel-dependent lactate racemase